MRKDYHFATKNVVSISAVCSDPELASTIVTSDYIRYETLRRLTSISSYKCKSLYWKNRYYDVIRAEVMKELGV